MQLKKDNKTLWELNDLEIVNGFFNSKIFTNKGRDLNVRLALYIAMEEPKGLQSIIVNSDEFIGVLDLVYLQMRLKGIKPPTYENRTVRKYTTKQTLPAADSVHNV